MYWTTCTVAASEAGREFAFTVGVGRRVVNTWRYQLEAVGDGTAVTESFELARSPLLRLYWRVAGRAREKTNLEGMRATLERVKAEVERRSSVTDRDR